MKILVIPDVHGRTFWRQPCSELEKYDKVVFLGDYLDPYDFEGISFEKCIDVLQEIIGLKKFNYDKVVLLLGNHDLPYFSDEYYRLRRFGKYFHRHSSKYHDEVHKIFSENSDLFTLSTVIGDVLFTHAGVVSYWLTNEFDGKYDDEINLSSLSADINLLLDKGIDKLSVCSYYRGGEDLYSSCVWADVDEVLEDSLNARNEDMRFHPIYRIKQIFGHTIQAFYANDRHIVFGKPREFGNCKMLDNAKAYELDIESFTIKEV